MVSPGNDGNVFPLCTPSELEGRGENNDKDIGDTVHLNTQTVHIKSVHTVQNISLPNVQKVQEEGVIEPCQAQKHITG